MEFQDKWELVKKLLEILGNETRVEILRLLSERQCYVSEIARELEIGQQAILRHLKLLSDFNFLESYEEEIEDGKKTRGRKRRYYTISENFPFRLLIEFSEDRFNVELQQEPKKCLESKIQHELLDVWPGLKFYEEEMKRINNIQNNVEKLRFVVSLTERLEEELNRHQLAIENINKLLNDLNKMKNEIKEEI